MRAAFHPQTGLPEVLHGCLYPARFSIKTGDVCDRSIGALKSHMDCEVFPPEGGRCVNCGVSYLRAHHALGDGQEMWVLNNFSVFRK